MPEPRDDHPSLLDEMFKDKRISSNSISFWKDRLFGEGLHVHFGKLDTTVISSNDIHWVPLDQKAYGWGIKLNQFQYGEEVLTLNPARNALVEFELGVPNIIVPNPTYDELCELLIKSSDAWYQDGSS